MTHGLARLMAAVTAVLLLAGCSLLGVGGAQPEATSNSTASAPAPDLTAFYRQTIVWSSCGNHYRCAWIKVPLDYAHPEKAQTELSVIRRPAAGHRLGSLVVNPGGPGVSGVDFARSGNAIVSKSVLQSYDLVGFDPRGVAASEPVDCVDDSQLDSLFAADGTPDEQAEVDTLATESAAVGAGCARRSPVSAPYLDSTSVARDMDVLRAVLGDETLNFLGMSYGSMLGALYAQLFPSRVGRIVLDGVLPNSLNNDQVAHGQAVGFDVALRRFVSWCIVDEDCPLPRDVDKGLVRISEFLDGLDATPLPGAKGRPLTQALGTFAILSHLYFPTQWIILEYGLDAAFQGDGSVLLDMADEGSERNSDGTYATNLNEAFFAVSCLDRPGVGGIDHARELATSWATDAPTFGATMAWGTLVCWQWPLTAVTVAGVDPRSREPIRAEGAGPILVVSTRYDPATPYQWGVEVASELSSGHLLTYEGDGHTAYRSGSACVDAAVDSYLLQGRLPVPGASCPAVRFDSGA